jgi:hypothetical protein
MSERLMAYCGLVCTECPAYIAKRTGDSALRAKTAKRWSGPDFSVSPEEVSCDGCAESGRELFRYCEACEVRSCAAPRGITTCAECPDYACDKLEKLFEMIGSETRETLDALRSGTT